MAHELAHLSQRHFARGIEEQRNQAMPNIAAMLAAVLIGIVGGGDAALAALSTVQAASFASQMRFSRARETEADRIGMNTLVRADLDPSGMSRMFERMQRAYRFTRRPPEFLLTHPLSETRIADARNQALDLPQEHYTKSVNVNADLKHICCLKYIQWFFGASKWNLKMRHSLLKFGRFPSSMEFIKIEFVIPRTFLSHGGIQVKCCSDLIAEHVMGSCRLFLAVKV